MIPTMTACASCGTSDHTDEDCRCGCHVGAGVVASQNMTDERLDRILRTLEHQDHGARGVIIEHLTRECRRLLQHERDLLTSVKMLEDMHRELTNELSRHIR